MWKKVIWNGNGKDARHASWKFHVTPAGSQPKEGRICELSLRNGYIFPGNGRPLFVRDSGKGFQLVTAGKGEAI